MALKSWDCDIIVFPQKKFGSYIFRQMAHKGPFLPIISC